MLPGWDPNNDINGDEYVDDDEFSALVNPNATARLKCTLLAFESSN